MNNNIYAYYQSIPKTNQGEEFECANWWKTSWTNRGWNPIMLNKSHAQASNLYGKLQQKLVGMMYGAAPELHNRIDWIMARFTRWCALHAAGGGWMSDYDVYNLDLSPETAYNELGSTTLAVNKGKAFLFYATKEHAENAIKKFISSDLIKGASVISESTILGVKDNIEDTAKLVKHIQDTKKGSRSVLMKGLFEK
jgi:hypothetical protein